jgi:TonB family protein
MTSCYSRSPAAASRWGLLLSLLLHGFFFLAVIGMSFSISRVSKPPEESISRVKLVDARSKPPVVEHIEQDPVEAPSVLPTETQTLAQPSEKVPERSRPTVETRKVASQNRDVITVKKRKRPLRRVETANEPAAKKPQAETAKNKEDSRSFLEKRLAAIRQEVESKKTDAIPPQSTKRGASSADEELVRWFNGVRTLINSHWSIIGDDRQLERITIVGVRIADNGRLMDASVDESSGDQVFDRSAIRAVFQAAPFPPIPSELKEKISRAGGLALRFTSKGMQ